MCTIMLGTAVFVQGSFVQALSNGQVTVSVGQKLFSGIPVTSIK